MHSIQFCQVIVDSLHLPGDFSICLSAAIDVYRLLLLSSYKETL